MGRRIRSVVIYVLTVFMFASVFVGYEKSTDVNAALPAMTEVSESDYYGRNQLESQSRGTVYVEAYDVIANAVKNMSSSVSLSSMKSGKITTSELGKVYEAVINDYPQYFWMQNGYSYSYSGSYAVSITPKYYSFSNITTAKASFESAVNSIISGIDMSMSAFERELIVHDRIAAKCSYVSSATYAHNSYGALVSGQAVCEGYARAFQYALYKVGINAYTVTGTASGGSHAWTMLELDGGYYYSDLTWDDQGTTLYHAYFNLPLNQMNRDHSADTSNIAIQSSTSTKYMYHSIVGDAVLSSYSVDNIVAALQKNMTADIYLTCDSSSFSSWFYDNVATIASKLGLGGYSFGYSNLGNDFIIFCKGTRTTVSPTSVTLNKTSYSFTEEGDTLQLTATVAPTTANNKTVTYTTSNKDVAIVDKYTGLVTCVGTGSAYITATTEDGSKTAKCTVTLKDTSYKNQWVTEDGSKYYYDTNGEKTTGWLSLDGKWYYLDATTGAMQTGWVKISGKWYYFDTTTGTMLTGWQKISSKWYYFNGSGVMQTGWVKISSKWYYFNGSGVMQTGWKQINSKWYYFNGSGVMQTGWKQINSKYYYFSSNGIMQASKWIGNYYLKSDGTMAVSEWVCNDQYYVDENGLWVQGAVK